MPVPAPNRATRPRPTGEQGYILLAVVFLTVMVLIALSVAAPNIARSIQRDREMELMHRGKQFQRAIQLYYRKFGAYPPTMDALEKTNNIRFLRKRYKDPITGKDEWHLIHFGEAKTQTLGFFGQPLAGTGSAGGSVMAGIGPSGGNQAAGGPLFGGSPITSTTPTPDPGTDPNAPTTDPSGQPTTPGATTPGTSGTTGTSGSGSGQTFGGGGIIGVESTSTKLAILEYKKKKHYNEWEFVYDPLADRVTISNNLGTNATGSNSSNGPSTANGNYVFNSQFGNPGVTTQTPPPPQQ